MLKRTCLTLVLSLLLVLGLQAQDTPLLPDGDKILVWIAPAVAPGRQTASQGGQIAYLTSTGAVETIMALPNGTTRVTPCGPDATSPDGSIFAFLTTITNGGVETGSIHLVRGTDSQVETLASNINPMMCYGSSPFEFAPDSTRYGYVEFAQIATNAASPTGILQIFNASDNAVLGRFDDVSDFDLSASGGAFVSFYKNAEQLATEVGIFVWDGANDREIATLRADENCYYASASITTLADGRLAALLAYHCRSQGTQWQLYLVDPASRSSRLERSEPSAGGYFPFTDSNAIFASPDGLHLFFTVPDGISNQTVSIRTASLTDLASVRTYIGRDALMPSMSDLPYDAYPPTANATARLSADGRYLAIVTKTPDLDATLNVIDFNAPNLPAISIRAGDRGDTISEMLFSADNSLLFYVAGGNEGANNSLFALNLATGIESRITRGRYAQGVLAPDSRQIAILQWESYAADKDPYLNLVVLDTFTTAETLLYEGGEVTAENTLINQSFAYPLSWRVP